MANSLMEADQPQGPGKPENAPTQPSDPSAFPHQFDDRYHALFNSIGGGFHISELMYDETGQVVDWRFLEVNQAFERQTGLQNVVGRLGSEVAPGTEPYWVEAYDQVVKTGKPLRLENYNQATGRWYTAHASRVGNQGSRQFVVVFEDITDRKKVEKELRESEEKYRALFDAIDEGVCLCELLYNDDGQPSDVMHLETNAAYVRMIGQAMKGKRAREVFPEANATWFQTYARVIETGESIRFENYLPEVDRWYELHTSRVGNQGSRLFIVIFINITEQKRADQRKDEFMAMLGHELRNPLASLSNTLLVLKLTGGTDESLSYPKAIDQMSRQVGHMTRMVDDLLDVGRIRYGLIQLHRKPIDLVKIVRQTVDTAKPFYQEQDRQLTLSVPPYSLIVLGDEPRLAQALMNLLTNSLRYTLPGGHVWVSLELVADTMTSEQVQLRVKDDGVGIAADQTETIFDIFVQGETTLDRPKSGLGLGLALVKQLVTLHGGSVEVFSEGLGEGSEFLIQLPFTPEAPKAEAPSQPDSNPDRGKVLVVDDNSTIADMMARLVKFIGYQARVCYTGADAVVVARQWQPDVILLDLGIPDMNGFEVNQRIREQAWGQTISIVALTGYSHPSLQPRTAQARFGAYLLKPVSLPQLKEVLATIMEQKKTGSST